MVVSSGALGLHYIRPVKHQPVMEKKRLVIGQDAYFKLQPLGRRPISGRGVVSEDLGRTEFKTSPKKNSSKSSKHLQAFPLNKDDTNEDDLDLLSPLDTLSSPSPPVHNKSKASKKSQASSDPHFCGLILIHCLAISWRQHETIQLSR